MTDNLLVGIAGIMLSLAFGYVPGLKKPDGPWARLLWTRMS